MIDPNFPNFDTSNYIKFKDDTSKPPVDIETVYDADKFAQYHDITSSNDASIFYSAVLPEFESRTVEKFFDLWQLLRFNAAHPSYTYDSTTGIPIVNDENSDNLNYLKNLFQIDNSQKDILLSDEQIVNTFFTNVVDQPGTFYTEDHTNVMNLIRDWFTVNRALVSKVRNTTDIYSLGDQELNDLILGFGFPYPYYIELDQKPYFLAQLIKFLQHKGSPDTLGNVLSFFGLKNIVISEWWLDYDPLNENLYMKSQPIWPRSERTNPDLLIQTSYKDFVSSDPHWYYDKPNNPSLIDIIDSSNQYEFPSLTPYFTIQSVYNFSSEMKKDLAVMFRKFQEAYNYWIEYTLIWQGNIPNVRDLPPTAPTNTLYHVTEVDSDYVYNGEEWVNLNCVLPDIKTHNNGADLGNPVRDLTIDVNGYSDSTASFYETMLTVYYLFKCNYASVSSIYESEVTDSTKTETYNNSVLYYRGDYSPVDVVEDTSGSYILVDGTNYDAITEEWNELNEAIVYYDSTNHVSGRTLRQNRLDDLFDKFYTLSYYDGTTVDDTLRNTGSFVWPLSFSSGFLKAANVELYNEVQSAFQILQQDYSFDLTKLPRMLELLLDQLISNFDKSTGYDELFGISQLVRPIPIYQELLKVINFFKPIHSRFVKFISNILIQDPVGDIVIVDDSTCLLKINMLLVEDAGDFNFDTGRCIDTGYFDIIPSVGDTTRVFFGYETKCTPIVSVWPTSLTDIVYGEMLMDTTIVGDGTASISGTFGFDNEYYIPNAGHQEVCLAFIPDDSTHYCELYNRMDLYVGKNVPIISVWPTASNIVHLQHLSDSTLSGGVADMSGSFSFINPTYTPPIGTESVSVQFIPLDTSNYEDVTSTVNITTEKQTPVIISWPTISLTYPEQLMDGTITGGSASVAGRFDIYVDNVYYKPTINNYPIYMKFTPSNGTEYKTIYGDVVIYVHVTNSISENMITQNTVIEP